ncbi:MAG: hypothetical protein R3292_07205 [Alcanivorax sp.]|nr:hypothetical protein [Alcanivorax sp.]
MKFLLLLVVLGLRRLDLGWPGWLQNAQRHQSWFQRCAGRLGEGQRLWWLTVFLPSVLVAMAFAYSGGSLGILLKLVLGLALLLWLLGPESEFRQVDELLVRGRMNDPQGFADLAEDEFAVTDGQPGEQAYQRQLMARILGREMQLFATIFWLVTLGYGAATFYLLNRAWLQRQSLTQGWLAELDSILSWMPRQLLILCMALAGDFSAVMARMNGNWWQRDDRASQLAAVCHEALSDELTQEVPASLPEAMDELEAMQGLLLRCLAVWLILSALWILLT